MLCALSFYAVLQACAIWPTVTMHLLFYDFSSPVEYWWVSVTVFLPPNPWLNPGDNSVISDYIPQCLLWWKLHARVDCISCHCNIMEERNILILRVVHLLQLQLECIKYCDSALKTFLFADLCFACVCSVSSHSFSFQSFFCSSLTAVAFKK